MAFIKVKFIKAAPKLAYSAGDVGVVLAEKVPDLVKGGFVIPLPDEPEPEKVNPLPEDLPARDKLFAAGFDNLEKISQAGDSLLDVVSNTMLKKIKKYLNQ